MNKSQAIETLNTLSANNTPCVFVITFDTSQSHIWELHNIPNNVLIQFPSFSNCTTKNISSDIIYSKKPIEFDEYKKGYFIVQNHLKRGNSFLVNLTAESIINTNKSIEDIFNISKAPFKICFKDTFVVFSPEPFVTISGNTIQTFPMKGTIDGSIPNAEQIILNNTKETAEHATIVDLLRNDISIVAKNVFVKKYRYIETIHSQSNTILQVSSEIVGEIKNEYSNKLGSILFSMLPAGSISGAPKKKTLEIISEAETHSRGYYTGVMGYFDGKNLESAVMIRYIEKRDNILYYKSGGGITTQSILEEEYNELIQKIYVPTY